MGRKIKKAVVIVAAGMAIGGQITDMSVFGSMTQVEAEDGRKVVKEIKSKKNLGKDLGDEEKEINENVKDEDDSDKDSDKDADKGDKDPDTDEDADKDDKDPDEDTGKEEIKLYHVEYSGPDGENGYYINCPDGRITHLSNRGVTRYLFENGNGERQEGTLGKLNESCVLKRLNFTNGRNEIEIWMEDEDGHLVENSESRKEFWLDNVRPVVQFEVSGGADIWHKEAAEIQVAASDGTDGSQIAEIICKTGEKVIGKSNKETEIFRIEEESRNGEGIPITIIAADLAGNQTTVMEKVLIDQDVPEISIQGIQDYMITSKPVEVNYRTEEENAFRTVQACTSKEGITGKKEEMEITGWKTRRSENSGKIEKESRQILTEDGIYKLRMDVTDMAGHENHMERQVIIDKENPVIAHVDELEGKYLKYFCWDYSVDESIKDFTSYTYVMKLDDMVYRPGEKIEKEGVHILTVEAVDSAGNKSEARARFTIDHTPPVIRFKNIKEGESYEKERKFYVRTENPEDQIEYIKINGEKQKSEKQKDVYECKVEKAKAYEVEVKAVDLAGNEQISRIRFQVEPERTFLQKITDPVRKYIFYGNGKNVKEEKQIKGEETDKRNGKRILWEGFTLAGILTGVGVWKREALKNIWGKCKQGRRIMK